MADRKKEQGVWGRIAEALKPVPLIDRSVQAVDAQLGAETPEQAEERRRKMREATANYFNQRK